MRGSRGDNVYYPDFNWETISLPHYWWLEIFFKFQAFDYSWTFFNLFVLSFITLNFVMDLIFTLNPACCMQIGELKWHRDVTIMLNKIKLRRKHRSRSFDHPDPTSSLYDKTLYSFRERSLRSPCPIISMVKGQAGLFCTRDHPLKLHSGIYVLVFLCASPHYVPGPANIWFQHCT